MEAGTLKEDTMLTEYLAEATLADRRRELARAMLVMEALALREPSQPGDAGRWTTRLQWRFSRSRRAAPAAGHSLSTME